MFLKEKMEEINNASAWADEMMTADEKHARNACCWVRKARQAGLDFPNKNQIVSRNRYIQVLFEPQNETFLCWRHAPPAIRSFFVSNRHVGVVILRPVQKKCRYLNDHARRKPCDIPLSRDVNHPVTVPIFEAVFEPKKVGLIWPIMPGGCHWQDQLAGRPVESHFSSI